MNLPSRLFAVALAAASLVLTGCGAPAHQLRNASILPEIDVVQVKENSDQALRIAQEAKLDVEMVNTKLTEMDNKLVLLSEEVATVSVAKIEELETRVALLIEALKDLQMQLDALQVSPRVRTPAAPVKGAEKGGAKAKDDTPQAHPSATFAITSPEYTQYQTALQTFNARNYKDAAKLFGDIIDQYPGGRHKDDCQYWIGECSYAQGDYAGAIAEYQKILSAPSSSKTDDALFKIGKSYLAMGQSGKAKELWGKLVVQYPSSEYVPRAKQYLTEVK